MIKKQIVHDNIYINRLKKIYQKYGEKDLIEYMCKHNYSEPHTLDEIAKIFGITRERVRQIEEKALKKLKHPKYGSKLKTLLEDNFDKDMIGE